MRVLDGVTVLEVSQWGFVPTAGAVLAEWGATVLKVEHPVHGDPLRGLVAAGMGPGPAGFTPMWEMMNRGKKSVGLDLGVPEGLETLMRLVERSDVFLTSFLPDARRRLGIDVTDVAARNPRIVYARGSGQGPRGPDAEKGGFDAISFWSRSGLATAGKEPENELPPRMPTPGFGDVTSGMYLAGGVAAALTHRERTGEAIVVDTSLLNAGMWAAQASIVGARLLDVDNIAWPSPHREPGNVLANTYRTSDDRYLTLNVLQGDRYWAGLCEALDRPELVDDDRFRDADARHRHRTECVAVLDEIFAARPLAEWVARLSQQEGQWDVVRTPREVGDDDQAWANEYLQDVDYGDGRSIALVSAPAQFGEAGNQLAPAPALGVDTDAVLLELGFDWDDLLRLKLENVIS